jgi:hypothetical protein
MPVYTKTPKENLEQRPWAPSAGNYIQSTGTQFIDTEFPITSDNLIVELEFMYTAFTDYGTIIGCQGDMNFILRQYGGGLWFYAGKEGTRLRDIVVNKKYTVKITVDNGTWTITVSPGSDGTSTADTFTGTYTGTIANNLNICLFNTTNAANGSYGSQAIASINAKAAIYSCKISQDGVQVRSFGFKRPVTDALAPLMAYDSVTKRIFHNKGTGNFEASVSISDSLAGGWTYPASIPEYQPLDYIETTGTQYIDTGYLPTPDTGIELDFMWLGSGTTAWVPVCGMRGANSNFYCWFIQYSASAYVALSPNYSTYDPAGGYTLMRNKRYKLSNAKGATLINGRVSHNTPLTIKQETKDTFHIGCISNNGTIDNRQPYMRIYGFQIFEKFAPVCDMRPCRRKADGVLGLYDLINGKFYTNKGTGEFVAGKVSRKKLVGIYKNGKKYSEVFKTVSSTNVSTGVTTVEPEHIYPMHTQYWHSSTFPESLIGGSIFVAVDANGNPEFAGYSSSYTADEYDLTTRYDTDSTTHSFVVSSDQTQDINYAYIRSKKYNGTPVEYWVGTYVNGATVGRGIGRATNTIYIPDTFNGKPVTRIMGGAFNAMASMQVQHFYVGNNATIQGSKTSPAIGFSCVVGLTVTAQPIEVYPIAHLYLGKNITENINAVDGTNTRIFYHFDKDHPTYYSNNDLYPEMVFNRARDTLYLHSEYNTLLKIPYGITTINALKQGYFTDTIIIPETVTNIVALGTSQTKITLVCKCPAAQILNIPDKFLEGGSKSKNTVTIYTDNLSLINHPFNTEYTTVTFYPLSDYVETEA